MCSDWPAVKGRVASDVSVDIQKLVPSFFLISCLLVVILSVPLDFTCSIDSMLRRPPYLALCIHNNSSLLDRTLCDRLLRVSGY